MEVDIEEAGGARFRESLVAGRSYIAGGGPSKITLGTSSGRVIYSWGEFIGKWLDFCGNVVVV